MTGVDPHGARTPQDIPDISLAEFYLARLDDEARIARGAAARAASWSVWDEPGRSEILAGGKPIARMNEEYAASYDAEHITRHDPARVLRDVQAKRRIVEQCAAVLAEFDRRDTWGAWPDFGPKHLAEDVLAQLAEVYADHPDYREEWRP